MDSSGCPESCLRFCSVLLLRAAQHDCSPWPSAFVVGASGSAQLPSWCHSSWPRSWVTSYVLSHGLHKSFHWTDSYWIMIRPGWISWRRNFAKMTFLFQDEITQLLILLNAHDHAFTMLSEKLLPKCSQIDSMGSWVIPKVWHLIKFYV